MAGRAAAEFELPPAERMARPLVYSIRDLDARGPFPQFHNKLHDLVEGLKFSSVQDFQAWSKSDLWLQYWGEYYYDHLKPAIEQKQQATDEDLPGILEAIDFGEADGRRRHSDRYGNRSDWTSVDHEAYFIYNVTRANLDDRHGVLYKKDFFTEWCIQCYVAMQTLCHSNYSAQQIGAN